MRRCYVLHKSPKLNYFIFIEIWIIFDLLLKNQWDSFVVKDWRLVMKNWIRFEYPYPIIIEYSVKDYNTIPKFSHRGVE